MTCAETAAAQHPDFVVESNWQSAVAPAVMKIWNKAKIPAVDPRRLASERDLRGRRQLHLRRDRRQGRRRIRQEDLGLQGRVGVPRRATSRRAPRPTCGSRASRTACRRSAASSTPASIAREIMDAGTTDQAHHQDDRLADGAPAGQARARRRRSTTRARPARPRRSSRAIATAWPSARLRHGRHRRGQGGDASKNHYLGCTAYFPEKYAAYAMSVAATCSRARPCRRRSTSSTCSSRTPPSAQYYK